MRMSEKERPQPAPHGHPRDRHRVVVIGSGFGGLFATQALKRADCDVTLISRTTTHLFQPLLYQVATGILSMGEIAPATREVLRRQQNATVLLGEVTDIDLERAHRDVAGRARAAGHPLRQPDRGRRRGTVLLRQRPVRRVRAGHEVHRRRAGAARAHLRLLRAGRAGHRPGGGPALPDVRGHRGRPDGRRDGRPDLRAVQPGAQAGLPPDRHHVGADRAAGRRARGPGPVRPEAVGRGRADPDGRGRRGAAQRQGRGPRRRRASPTRPPTGSGPSSPPPARSGPPGSPPPRSAPCWPSAAGRRSTGPGGSWSSRTSRCPGIPRSSSSAT